MTRITHLILSGGAAHGCIYLGVFRYLYLENMHHDITHISSCSIGSLAAILFSFKLTIEELEDVIYKLFQLDKLCFIPRGNYIYLFTQCGLTKTEYITSHAIEYLKNKYPEYDIENTTFMDVSKRFGINLYISTTNLHTCSNQMFSIDNTPNEKIFRACAASMVIPFLFAPVKIGDQYFIDGGFSNNFPSFVFDSVPDECKFGIAINGENKNDGNKKVDAKITFFYLLKQFIVLVKKMIKTETFFKYIHNTYTLIFEKIQSKYFKYEIHKNGVKIFNTSEEDINNMIVLGFHETSKYLCDKK
jgi:predicted acylesterase/phospholipase RssA